MVDHFAGCIHLPTQTATDEFPGKFFGPLKATWTTEGGGHQSCHAAQTAFVLWGLISISRSGPYNKGRCATMQFPPLFPSGVRRHRHAHACGVGTWRRTL